MQKAGNIHMQHCESQPRIIMIDTKYYSTRTNETRIGLVGMPRFDFEVQNVDL